MEAESLFLSNKKPLCWKHEAENVENKILFMVDIHLKYVWITHVRKQPTDQWHGQITAGPVKATQGTETIKWCSKRKS